VHHRCVRAGYYEEGIFAHEYGERECLVEIGCWGPVVQCNITTRGAINHMGGCMNTGGICIGCTMPGFPDKFAPFYRTPPGTVISTNASRAVGSVVRRLRKMTRRYQNREPRWDREGEVPSGWGDVEPLTAPERVARERRRRAGWATPHAKGPRRRRTRWAARPTRRRPQE
jgi:hydrogenase small subunit